MLAQQSHNSGESSGEGPGWVRRPLSRACNAQPRDTLYLDDEGDSGGSSPRVP